MLARQGVGQIFPVLSSDIPPRDRPEHLRCRVVSPGETCILPQGQTLKAYRSTDLGVAFCIRDGEERIYHAGDLNWWVWKEETKQYNHNMTANFKKYTAPLEGMELFAAFLPLDPRQEDWYDKGFLYILEHTKTAHVFPMHFWKDYSIIRKFLSMPQGQKYKEQIMLLEKEGQVIHCPENKEDK